MITASICVTDIDNSKITTSEKNGKKYLNIVIDERKEPDNYWNTHTIYINQTKEEREAKVNRAFTERQSYRHGAQGHNRSGLPRYNMAKN